MQKKRMCGCKNQECPVNGKCLTKSLIYKATVKPEKDTRSYVGSTGLSFKDHYTKHKAVSNMKNMATLQLYCNIYGSLKIIKLILELIGKY